MEALTLKEKYLYFVKVSKKNTNSQVVVTFSFCIALMLLKFI
ncbi:hypothetical protein SAMN05446037_101352 [Anaerovirgula multivorans]|uniref:Uncharacterized protein n=1 Tax=Anaerovirgula multivorans TaxID=312168 RepID=A0A239FK57_9FIRM|nr:hypothetical protein [Anaerovirgula multivorans]SNS57141.1 hypothetical protein SAMN05446037_101352 [Anaerovirgula multivorans]